MNKIIVVGREVQICEKRQKVEVPLLKYGTCDNVKVVTEGIFDRRIKRIAGVCVAFLFMIFSSSKAQGTSVVGVCTKADVVSSYVWRGIYEAGLSVQPALGMTVRDFSVTAWGSTDTQKGYKEVDFTVAYTKCGATISLTDYWWGGQSGIYNDREGSKNNYFHFGCHQTEHIMEAGMLYNIPFKRLPLSLSWNTMFWGDDKKTDCNGRKVNAYSSYAEISSPFAINNMAFLVSLGCSPFKSPENYKNKDFAITNISFKVSRNIKINDKFSIPIFSQLVWNVDREDVHFVFGVTLQ